VLCTLPPFTLPLPLTPPAAPLPSHFALPLLMPARSHWQLLHDMQAMSTIMYRMHCRRQLQLLSAQVCSHLQQHTCKMFVPHFSCMRVDRCTITTPPSIGPVDTTATAHAVSAEGVPVLSAQPRSTPPSATLSCSDSTGGPSQQPASVLVATNSNSVQKDGRHAESSATPVAGASMQVLPYNARLAVLLVCAASCNS
jgi:hypothetical protein